MPGEAPLAGIVLAAGAATRFGGPKQLARVGGATLVARAARLALATCPSGVVIVTGAHAPAVEAGVADLPVGIVRNLQWSAGIAGSIRCGLDALPAEAGACLVLLCDQPTIDEADIGELLRAWRASPDRAAAAHYAGASGVPAIFPASTWPALRAIEGDRGAKGLLAGLPDVSAVAMPHAALDVDTPADLATCPGAAPP
jgi:molybdenum cofactor cytidylyltransferase